MCTKARIEEVKRALEEESEVTPNMPVNQGRNNQNRETRVKSKLDKARKKLAWKQVTATIKL